MTRHLREERGFVLSMVIFAVAALSIAGTALFLVVQSENAMANAGAESSAALHLANAGLSRYMGETFGMPDSSVTYQMGGGTVTVTATIVVPLGDTADVYMVRSEAEIEDRRVSGLVSRRAVQQFARLRKRPLNPVAALAVATSEVRSNTAVVLDGADACGTAGSVAGIATTGAAARDLNGSISSHASYPSSAALLAAMDVDWDVLTDPGSPVDYEDRWPPALLAAGDSSYPTIRFNDDVDITWMAPSGRGLLIVKGTLTLSNSFFPWNWDGVIIAESIEIRNNARADIEGSVLTGFGGTQGAISGAGLKNIQIHYNSCSVLGATRGVAMFAPMSNTWWEPAG